MRRILLLTIAMALMFALAAPGSATVRDRQAKGTTTFTLIVTCNPGPPIAGVPDCVIEGTTLFITISNPGAKTGTFKGTQVFDATVAISLLDPTRFTFTGTTVFTGKVKACGSGTVIFDTNGSGSFDANGDAIFDVNDATVSGGTLPMEGTFSELGNQAPTNDAGMGSIDYEGSYTCDKRGG